MSERERQTVLACLAEIQEELHHSIDRHSRRIITSHIEVLLNHCLRFYDGLPTVGWCAGQLHFSANYFGDLIKKETGKSAIEHIHLAIINRVKDLLASTGKTVSEIAYEVGFQYPHHLSRMFKKTVGCTPNEYRVMK